MFGGDGYALHGGFRGVLPKDAALRIREIVDSLLADRRDESRPSKEQRLNESISRTLEAIFQLLYKRTEDWRCPEESSRASTVRYNLHRYRGPAPRLKTLSLSRKDNRRFRFFERRHGFEEVLYIILNFLAKHLVCGNNYAQHFQNKIGSFPCRFSIITPWFSSSTNLTQYH